MGAIPGQDANPTIICMICGRPNAADRKFCENPNCKQKLHDPVIDRLRAALQSAQDENQQLRQKHASSQDENQQLLQQLQPLKEEVDRLKATRVDPEHVAVLTGTLQTAEKKAADMESHAAGWENKWKSAEQKAAALEAELAAKVKEVEEFFKSKPETPNVAPEHVAALQTAEKKAADMESHAAGWQSKWKFAEEKAAALEAKLAAKVKEVEEFFKSDPKVTSVDPEHVAVLTSSLQTAEEKAAGLQSQAADLESKWKAAEQRAAVLEAKLAEVGKVANPRLKYIFGIITFLGSLGGYGAGRYVQPKNVQPKNDFVAKVNQLTTQVTNAKQQIGELTSELKSANAKADQVQTQAKADLDSANQQNSALTAHQLQVQHQLKDAAQKASIADQTQKQLRQDLDSANRKISGLTTSEQQLQRELADANAQKASANQTVAQLNAEIARQHTQSAPKGSLVWSGNLTGKRTINIKNGVPDFGTLSGALPQKPCTVSTQDASVKIKNRPSKNHLNDLSFEVSGSGLVQVRIAWEISQ